MNWAWILIGFEYLILAAIFGRSVIKVIKEQMGIPVKRFMQSSRDKKAEQLKEMSGIKYANKIAVEALYTHLKVNTSYGDDELKKIDKLFKQVKRELVTLGHKHINPSVVISVILNSIIIKANLSWNKNIKELPNIKDVANLVKNNISSSRIVVLYSEGLSMSDIFESRSIAQAHAVALYS